VTPTNHFVNWQQDPQGNWLARFVFPEKATELKIEVDFTAQMTVVNPFDFLRRGVRDQFSVPYTSDLKTELAPYLATSDQGPKFAAYLKDIRARPTVPSISWSAQCGTAEEDQLCHPDGAGHSRRRKRAVLRLRSLPATRRGS